MQSGQLLYCASERNEDLLTSTLLQPNIITFDLLQLIITIQPVNLVASADNLNVSHVHKVKGQSMHNQ